jgi:glycosyltransferase involved in cell wall biosynthesis
MKILWITNIPSPYRIDFFNELGKFCELKVIFEKKYSDERDSLWKVYKIENFKGIFLEGKSINTDTAFCPGIIKEIKHDKYDHIVLTNISSPTGIFAALYMKSKRIPYWIEGDGAFYSQKNGIKSRIKKMVKTLEIKGAKGYFSTGKSHDEYYLAYGADPNMIFRYPFSSISNTTYNNALSLTDLELQENREIFCRADEIEKRAIIRKLAKNRLQIPNTTKVILFVGQMIYRKGIDVLLECANKLCNNHEDVIFILVGGSCPKSLEDKVNNMPEKYIRFVPFMSHDELQYYYRAADIFLFPTREDIWGLVINEAMTYSLPIVTTDRCGAGNELVCEGLNGYIVKINDIEKTTQKIDDILLHSDAMGKESRKIIKEYTIEQMAYRHLNVFGGSFANERAL